MTSWVASFTSTNSLHEVVINGFRALQAISLSQGRGKRGLQLRQEARGSRPTPDAGRLPTRMALPFGNAAVQSPAPPEQTLTLADGCS